MTNSNENRRNGATHFSSLYRPHFAGRRYYIAIADNPASRSSRLTPSGSRAKSAWTGCQRSNPAYSSAGLLRRPDGPSRN